MPNGVWVTVTIPDDKVEEFLKVMKVDMTESRKEEGCLRFDLLDKGNGVYSFYGTADSLLSSFKGCEPQFVCDHRSVQG